MFGSIDMNDPSTMAGGLGYTTAETDSDMLMRDDGGVCKTTNDYYRIGGE